MYHAAVRVVPRLSLLAGARRGLPAPSASWDPSRSRTDKDTTATATVELTVRLPEDAVLSTRARVGLPILDALEMADLSDVWPGGACGGACNVRMHTTAATRILTAPYLLL